MLRRFAFLLAITTVLLLAVIAVNLTSLSIAKAAPPADAQKWEYAVMVYTSKDGTVTAVTIDDDERKEINDFFKAFAESVNVDKIPAIYYANIMGRYGWHLVSHETDNSGELFYFEREPQS